VEALAEFLAVIAWPGCRPGNSHRELGFAAVPMFGRLAASLATRLPSGSGRGSTSLAIRS
jgi:hypothetical protein